MSYTVTIKNNESGNKHEFIGDYIPHTVVYYVFKKRKKWVIRKSQIGSIWYTNTFGYQLDNGWCICDDEFDKLHKNKDDAIAQCIELNKKALVKIYNKDCYSFVGGCD